jgi:mannosyltransferase OCH1-like enzyme
MAIPRLIHQTYSSIDALDPAIRNNCDRIRLENPEFNYHFYSDQDQINFIRDYYDSTIFNAFNSIDPAYGAARADFFRYLCMYQQGGVYLDVKADVRKPLISTLLNSDDFILSKWDHSPDSPHLGWGNHPALARTGCHAYQQWFIICSARHPYLKAVIDMVVKNIETYNPFRHFRNSWSAVMATTGEIPYTLAIAPIRTSHPHRELRIEKDLHIYYSIFQASSGLYGHHKPGAHYSQQEKSLIRQSWPLSAIINTAYTGRSWARNIKRKLI